MDGLTPLKDIIHVNSPKSIQPLQSTTTDPEHTSDAGNPECPDCHGAGFKFTLDSTYPKSMADLKPCHCYGWWKNKDRTKAVARNLMAFENFEAVSGANEAFKRAKEIADGSARYIWLLLYGGPGCGKTHLLRAIESSVRARGLWCSYHTVPDLFATLKAGMADNSTESIMKAFKEAQYLLLDELGMEMGSDWERARFDELMERRYRDLLVTVVATNLDLSYIPQRILSRFQDADLSRIVRNDAQDYRPKKGK